MGQWIKTDFGSIAFLDHHDPFPNTDQALIEPNGLIAISNILKAERIIEAYKQGIFPWFNHNEPILWWSPNPRLVLFPDDLKISSSLSKKIKKNNYQFEIDKNFISVIKSCSEVKRKDQDGTWIDERIIKAYSELYQMEIAHSFEIYFNENLVGGLYGIILDNVFFGESMFYYETDASKIAFVLAVQYLKNIGVKMIDCQMKTKHLLSFGAKEITRNQFIQLLNTYIKT
ncbi:MAG TPA: leucyl/phenylalanyl-tRNA--protein transferase [Candidatus Methylopumilus sp.]|jgi:leucyl/phenylalanyl-tRNA--protein transferase